MLGMSEQLRPGEKGDLELMWELEHSPEAIRKRERKARQRLSKIKRLRKNGLAAWVNSLEVGDEVVVRFPWQDKSHPGGRTTRAWVKWVKEDRILVHWMTFGGERGINEQSNIFGRPFGGGGAYHALMHPTRKIVYAPELGYVFETEYADWKRRRAAWETRRANGK
jgi:hypothetical protein